MESSKMTNKTKRLLESLLQSDNPTQLLDNLYEKSTGTEMNTLHESVQALCDLGCISIPLWADNKPYHVIVNKTKSKEMIDDFGSVKSNGVIIIQDNSIQIGDDNRIRGSIISSNKKTTLRKATKKRNNSFYSRHPVLCGFLISLAAGLILLFSFWQQIVRFIEGVFHG